MMPIMHWKVTMLDITLMIVAAVERSYFSGHSMAERIHSRRVRISFVGRSWKTRIHVRCA